MSNINELRRQVQEYDRLYRLGEPVISDTEYDKLFNEIKRLEAKSGEIVPADSPTRQVGADSASNKEVVHKVPMLSIENCYSTGELMEFGQRIANTLKEDCGWVVELKIDGVSLSLVYEHGELVQGITRGNGLVGSDVTHNLDMITDVPRKLKTNHSPLPASIEVRGEVYMLNSDLDELNRQQEAIGGKIYKNTRNLTTGTISLKDPKEETDVKKRSEIENEHQRRKLKFFAHSIGSYEGINAKTHWDFLQELGVYGIPVETHTQRFDTFEEAVAYCESLYSGFRSTAEYPDTALSELDFEIDGLVLKVDDFSFREKLGVTGHHPRWVIAYKVEKYEAETVVRDIRVQVGKAGTITPVAELEPVEIAGTTVSRASLHNAEEIERKDVRVGDTVIVEKAGKIIPHIVRVEKHLRRSDVPAYRFPTECPVCGSPLVKDTDTVYIRCNNPLCPAQFKEKLRYFSSRNAMDIEGLGDKLIDILVDGGFVKTFADLYVLKDKKEELAKKDRLGKKSIEKLLDAIEKSKNRELRYFINALSIPNVGTNTARDLARYFGSLNKLLCASVEELNNIDNIGDITAKSIAEYFCCNKEMLHDLMQHYLAQPLQPENRETFFSVFAGKTFVITGTLSKPRYEFVKMIEQRGGKVSGSISSKISFVLVGTDAGSKLTKAQQLGITTVSEAEFLEMLTARTTVPVPPLSS